MKFKNKFVVIHYRTHNDEDKYEVRYKPMWWPFKPLKIKDTRIIFHRVYDEYAEAQGVLETAKIQYDKLHKNKKWTIIDEIIL